MANNCGRGRLQGMASGVNFSADGEIVAAACEDGTIRWLRWSDGQELLAFFVEPQSRKWVAWTPTGYYMASAGGEDLIGWQVNRGWEQEADFFPASQFRAQYNRPDIVRLVLQTRDEAEAVRRANAESERGVEAKPIATAAAGRDNYVAEGRGAFFYRHGRNCLFAAIFLRPPDRPPRCAGRRPAGANNRVWTDQCASSRGPRGRGVAAAGRSRRAHRPLWRSA